MILQLMSIKLSCKNFFFFKYNFTVKNIIVLLFLLFRSTNFSDKIINFHQKYFFFKKHDYFLKKAFLKTYLIEILYYYLIKWFKQHQMFPLLNDLQSVDQYDVIKGHALVKVNKIPPGQ
jgi:hypothetical protein